jgi:phage baseplate assembly protein W
MADDGPAILSEEYTWRSAGQTPVVVRDNIFLGQNSEKTLPPSPIGIKLPLQLGSERSGIFEMHFDSAEAISTNLRNLVMTNHGERVGNFLYGANLGPLCTEYSAADDFDAEAMRRIQTAVSNFLPMVQLNNFTANFIENSDSAVLVIEMSIEYDIPSISSIGNILRTTFSVI